MRKSSARRPDEISGHVPGGRRHGTGDSRGIRKKIYSLRRGNTGDSLQHIGKVLMNVYDRLEELAASGSEIAGPVHGPARP